MLHDGHQYLVTGLDVRKPVAVRHEVQPLGGVAGKDYLRGCIFAFEKCRGRCRAPLS